MTTEVTTLYKVSRRAFRIAGYLFLGRANGHISNSIFLELRSLIATEMDANSYLDALYIEDMLYNERAGISEEFYER